MLPKRDARCDGTLTGVWRDLWTQPTCRQDMLHGSSKPFLRCTRDAATQPRCHREINLLNPLQLLFFTSNVLILKCRSSGLEARATSERCPFGHLIISLPRAQRGPHKLQPRVTKTIRSSKRNTSTYFKPTVTQLLESPLPVSL